MKFIKRIAAIALIATTMVSLTACADTTWVFDYEGKQISSGLYISQTMAAYSLARSNDQLDPEEKDFFKQTIDDKSVDAWIRDEAKLYCDKYMAINNKFDELSLTLSEDDQKIIDKNTADGWGYMGDLYSENSVSENTYRMIIENQRKRQMVFEKYYGEGGIEEVSNDNLTLHFKENFAEVNMFSVNLATGDDITDEQKDTNKAVKDKAAELVKKINSGDLTFNEACDELKHASQNDKHDDKNEEDVIKEDKETKKIVRKDTTTPSEKVVKTIFDDLKVDGDAVVVTEDTSITIVMRYDVLADETNFPDMRSTILSDIKAEPFKELEEGWAKELSAKATVNEASISRYKPKNITFG